MPPRAAQIHFDPFDRNRPAFVQGGLGGGEIAVRGDQQIAFILGRKLGKLEADPAGRAGDDTEARQLVDRVLAHPAPSVGAHHLSPSEGTEGEDALVGSGTGGRANLDAVRETAVLPAVGEAERDLSTAASWPRAREGLQLALVRRGGEEVGHACNFYNSV